jgi:hypothetical protein
MNSVYSNIRTLSLRMTRIQEVYREEQAISKQYTSFVAWLMLIPDSFIQDNLLCGTNYWGLNLYVVSEVQGKKHDPPSFNSYS